MTPAPAKRYDLAWRRGNLAVLIVLVSLAAAALGARGLLHTRDLGPVPQGLARRSAAAREMIDPNTASAASMRRLPQIGPALARAIITARQPATSRPAASQPAASQPTGRPFKSLDDLRHRRIGIGPKTAQLLAPYLVFDQ